MGLAALLLYGRRLWPGITLASLTLSASIAIPLPIAVTVAVGHTLEAVCASLIIERLARPHITLDRLGDVLALVAAAIVGALISAGLGGLALDLLGMYPPGAVAGAIATWWLSNLLGLLLVGSLIVTWADRRQAPLLRARPLEATALLAGLTLACYVVFLARPLDPRGPAASSAAFVVFPFMIWAALRFHARGAATTTFLIAVFAVAGALLGRGMLARSTFVESVPYLEVYLAVVGVTGLVLGAVIASHHRVTARLQETEAANMALLRVIPDTVLRLAEDGRVVDIIATGPGFIGVDPDVRQRQLEDLLPEPFAAAVRSALRAAIVSGRVQTVEGATHDTTRLQWELRIFPAGVGEAFAIARDVTLRQIAEEAVRENEERFRALVEGAPEAIVVLDPETGLFVDCNDKACRLFGLPRRALLRTGPVQMSPELQPDGRRSDEVAGPYIQEAQAGSPQAFSWVHRHADGRALPCEVRLNRFPSGGRQLIRASISDVSDLLRMNEELAQSEERYRLLFQHNPQPMLVYDTQTLAVVAVNQAAIARYGYAESEFLRLKIEQLRPPEDVALLRHHLERRTSTTYQSGVWRHQTAAGEVFEVEVTSHEIQFAGRACRIVLMVDVSERHRLEEQLRQSQKMEAIGRLAGGVAHDFNNILTAISGYADLVVGELDPAHPVVEDVLEIQLATRRAADLTRQLLTFSRKQLSLPRDLDMNDVVRGMEPMLRRLLNEEIEFSVRLEATGFARADQSHLEQILLNLAVNANDAMPGGGQLLVATDDVTLDAPVVRMHAVVPEGTYVRLTVQDSGVGMPREVLDRVFEPFFTTKEVGKGTGLGLSTVYGIVKQSQGHIEVESDPGQGTSFRVYLPWVTAGPEPAKPARVSPPSGTGRPRPARILVVEDEPAVRGLIRRTLAAASHDVLTAADGREALDAVGDGPPIDLLVSDVIMPGMRGTNVAAALRERLPDLPVLFLSGYTGPRNFDQEFPGPRADFLQKPFTAEDLVRKVNALLKDLE